MERLKFTVTGQYLYPLPPELVTSLEATIQQHFKAYGLRDVEVSVEIEREEKL